MRPKVVIQAGRKENLYDYELKIAMIMAQYFETEVMLLEPARGKTPDLKINNEFWEIKSPKGNGKKTIENNLRNAGKQSRNVILDLHRCKLTLQHALSRTRFFLNGPHNLKKLLVISKQGEVIWFYRLDKGAKKS